MNRILANTRAKPLRGRVQWVGVVWDKLCALLHGTQVRHWVARS